jgi:16S rRNA (uracil1498-N3)-methyltransferase
MFYCFIPPGDIRDGLVAVTGENFRHLGTVLRAAPGETIRVRSDRFIYEARIETVGTDRILARIVSSREAGPVSSRRVVLAPALIQEKNFDLMLQQSVQLGVSLILPVLARNVANHRVKPGRLERWRKIVRAACMQSQRAGIPEIRDPEDFQAVVAGYAGQKGTRMIMPYELEEGRVIDASLLDGAEEAVVFIGPEGGWSADEAASARANGVATVSLGRNILRSETAALVSLTLVCRSFEIL